MCPKTAAALAAPLLAAALAGCGGSGTADNQARECDPGDQVHRAVGEDPVVRTAETRTSVGTRDGQPSRWGRLTRECSPILYARQWTVGMDPLARAKALDAEVRAAGWRRLPDPSPHPRSPYALTMHYDKDITGHRTTLTISYKEGDAALAGLVRVLSEHLTPRT